MAGVLCPPRWACLPICLPSHLVLSFTLTGVLCPPRWACLPICLPSGFVFHLGWGAVSASLGLSPNLSPIWLCLPVFSPHLFPIWLCLSPWLGCCVRLAGLVSGLVSQFVSHLAVSQFSLAICFPSGFVFHLGWGAVSASLGLSPNLFPTWLCLSPWLGCCVRLAGLVSQFVSHPIWLCLSPWLVGVLCPPRWACLWSCLPICLLSGFVSQFCLPICLPSGFVFHLGWGAVSASLGLSLVLSSNLSPNLSFIWLCLPVLFPHLFPIWLCLSPWLGFRVRLAGLVSGLPPGFVSQFCLPISFPCGFVFHLGWGAVSASLGLSANLSPIWLCLSPWVGCCVRLAELVSCLPICLPVFHLGWGAVSLVSQFVFHIGFVFHLGWGAVSASLGLSLVLSLVFHLGWGAASASLSLSPNLSPIWLCLSHGWGAVSASVGLSRNLPPIPSGFVFHLGWVVCPSGFVFHLGCGAVSAALGLSPNLSSIWLCLSPWLVSPHLFPIWLCLSPWLGCCVRLAGLVSGLVSQFVSHLAVSQFSLAICFPSGFVSQFVSDLALSFTLAGVLCPPRWACLPICLPSHLALSFTLAGGGAVSASLGLSLVLSPNLSFIWLCLPVLSSFVSHLALSFTLAGVLCPPRWACLWSCLFYLALSPSFVAPFVSHLALSFTLAGVLCPPRWACLRSPIWLCLPVLPPHFSPMWLCLSPWLGCCVCLAGLVCGLVLFCLPSCFPASVWSCFQLVSNVN